MARGSPNRAALRKPNTCTTCNGVDVDRLRASWVTENWWIQCAGLIWKVKWGLRCEDCRTIYDVDRIQHHRWGTRIKTFRITKKRSWQKKHIEWVYMGPWPYRCATCDGCNSPSDAEIHLLPVWQRYTWVVSAGLCHFPRKCGFVHFSLCCSAACRSMYLWQGQLCVPVHGASPGMSKVSS